MEAHPITDYPYRWTPALGLSLFLVIAQTALLRCYTDTDWIPALIDGITTIGWFIILSYLSWFIVGTVSMCRTNIITGVTVILLWLAGSFMICDIMVRIAGMPYIPFVYTIPFRLLFGIPAWIAILLWYHLQQAGNVPSEEANFPIPEHEEISTEEQVRDEPIDRITVKDGSRIHIIKVEELLYIQACGDYTTLVTSTGEYIKEQTMKYLETHLPADNFVRIHRSSIVNITQISRLELLAKKHIS